MTDNLQNTINLLKKILPEVLDETTTRLNRHMPDLFGYDNIDEMTNDTAEKSKLIAPVFAKSLEVVASRETPEYVREETNGYDNVIFFQKIEDKLTLTSTPSSFATGNNHSKVKVPLVFCVKVQNVGNYFPAISAFLVDCSKFKNPDSGFSDGVTKTGKNNNGFSQLSVHKDDAAAVHVIYGNVVAKQKWLHTVYETRSN
ncbi:hypothetical protein EBS02_01000 [bacterium]|nr:hypothetical protein [bacterium]